MLSLFLMGTLAWGQEGSGDVSAQPEDSVESSVEEPEPSGSRVTPQELHELEAAAFYKVGLELVTEGRFEEALVIFEKLQGNYADTAISGRAQQQASALALLGSEDSEAAVKIQEQARRDYEAAGWEELALNQGLAMPLILGFLVPAASFQPDEPIVPVLMGMAGLGIGTGGAFYLDKVYELDRGHAMAVFTGQWAGLLNGYMFSAIAQPRDPRGHYQYMLGGTLVGAGAGAAFGHYLPIDSGDMALINSGAMWGGVLAATSFLFWEAEGEADGFGRLIGTMDLGMVVAGVLSTRWQTSRKQMGIINLSGVAGGGLGFGTAILMSYYGSLNEDGAWMTIFGGAVLGAGLGAYLTRDMDGGSGSPASALVHLGEDGWSMGTPAPTLFASPSGHATWGLSFASGQF